MPRLLAALALALTAGTALADNWPQWRGPHNDGVCAEKNLPTKWDEKTNVAWRVDLPGIGASTPAVWGDRIFLTAESGKKVVALCISTSGKELWRIDIGSTTLHARGDEGSAATASPSTDGKHVWFFAGSGELTCVDFAGKDVWRFNVQDRYGKFKNQFGMHSTPVLFGDRIYLQLIHENAAVVVALEKETGKEVWKVNRESDGVAENEHSYASPVMWSNGKESYLIAHGNDYATAHRLKDGSEIWRLGDLNVKDRYDRTLRFVASPVATPDLIVVPSAKRGPVVALKPDATGVVMKESPYVQFRFPVTPDVPAPLVKDGFVYLLNADGNFMLCVDAKSGKQVYRRDLFKGRVRHRASPAYADGNVYLLSKDGGTATVVKAGPKFELVATNKLDDTFAASPAFADGRIYLRGYKSLYAIGEK
jgi:outer membrane protein assembly factor BamB